MTCKGLALSYCQLCVHHLLARLALCFRAQSSMLTPTRSAQQTAPANDFLKDCIRLWEVSTDPQGFKINIPLITQRKYYYSSRRGFFFCCFFLAEDFERSCQMCAIQLFIKKSLLIYKWSVGRVCHHLITLGLLLQETEDACYCTKGGAVWWKKNIGGSKLNGN